MLTDAYVVPTGASTLVSSVVVCNRSATDTTFRLTVAVAGAATADAQYNFYDVPMRGNETRAFTIGATLASTDVVRVYNTLATLSFNFYGVETT